MGLPLFVAKLIGRGIANKFDLTEGPLEPGQKWYKSKTILSDIATILATAYEGVRLTLAPQMGWNLPPIPVWLFTILGAVGIHGRVTATKTIG